jgi:hypothetical protein
LHREIEGGAASEARSEIVGVKDRLPPGIAAGLGHDRRDHVHELRDAGHLHHVGAADEGVDDAADLQHVLEIVDVLEEARLMRPAVLAVEDCPILLVGVVPDVPLVEADGDVLLALLLGADELDRRRHRADVLVQSMVHRQIVGGVFGPVVEVHVERDVID